VSSNTAVGREGNPRIPQLVGPNLNALVHSREFPSLFNA